jgi:two-component sensor histidine kinase
MSDAGARRRVLYIDDDQALGRLVQRDLGRRGLDVVHAPGGRGGVETACSERFDVICLDHYMPDQDGLETLERLRELPSVPPIVYVTGSEEGRIAVAALRAGAADYVIKGVGEDFLSLLHSAVLDAIEREELRRHKARIDQEIREARDRAERLASQQAVLLREVNHRVANSLQLIASLTQLQQSHVPDPAARAALASVRDRVVAMAQVHRRLYTSDNIRQVSLDSYIGGLIEEIERSIDRRGQRIELKAPPLLLSADKAVSLGLLIAELVTNAIKYAYPTGEAGPIRVELRAEDGEGVLTVEDEGVGLPATDKEKAGGTGFGRRIVNALAASLGGRAEYVPSERGTRVEIRFALKA